MDKITSKHTLSAQGFLEFDGNDAYLSLEDGGSYLVLDMLREFDGMPVKISVTAEVEYGKENAEDSDE